MRYCQHPHQKPRYQENVRFCGTCGSILFICTKLARKNTTTGTALPESQRRQWTQTICKDQPGGKGSNLCNWHLRTLELCKDSGFESRADQLSGRLEVLAEGEEIWQSSWETLKVLENGDLTHNFDKC